MREQTNYENETNDDESQRMSGFVLVSPAVAVVAVVVSVVAVKLMTTTSKRTSVRFKCICMRLRYTRLASAWLCQCIFC